MEVDVERHAPAALPPEKRPDALSAGGWWGMRAGVIWVWGR